MKRRKTTRGQSKSVIGAKGKEKEEEEKEEKGEEEEKEEAEEKEKEKEEVAVVERARRGGKKGYGERNA